MQFHFFIYSFIYLFIFCVQLKVKPSLKVCRGVLSKLSESNVNGLAGASSELSSPDSGSEA